MRNLIYIIIALSFFSSVNAETNLKNHGEALQFSNKSNSSLNIVLGDSSGLEVSDFAIEFWFSTKELSSGNIIKVYDTSKVNYISVDLDDGDLTYSMNMGEKGYNYEGITAVNDSQWHHITLSTNVYDDDGNIGVIINAMIDGNNYVNQFRSMSLSGVLNKLSINIDSNISFAMDELRFWNNLVEQSDLRKNITKQIDVSLESPFIYYNFDEKIGTDIFDVGINSYDTNISNNITRLNFLGDNLELDGIDDYVELGNSSDLNNSTFSVSLWHFNDYNLSISKGTLISDNNGSAGYSLEYLGSSLLAKVNDENVSISQDSLSMGWNYISMTYDSGILKLYVNSDEKNTTTTGLSQMNSSNLNLLLGAQPEGISSTPKANTFIKGVIAEVSIFNRVLTSNELNYNMHSSLKVNTPGLISYWPIQKIKTSELSSISIQNVITDNLSLIRNGASYIDTAPEIYGETIYSSKPVSNYFKFDNNESATFTTDDNVSSYTDVDFITKSFLYTSSEANESITLSVNTTPSPYTYTIKSKNYPVDTSLLPSIGTITLSELNSTVARLSWDGTAAYGFDIYRNENFVGHTYLKDFTDSTIVVGETLNYVVTAKNAYGNVNSSLNSKTILQVATVDGLAEAMENTIPGGIVELNSSVLGTNIIYVNKTIDIPKEIKLIGDGNITFDGNFTSRLFYSEGADLEIQNVTLQNANVNGPGAAITIYSNLRLINVNLNNNQAGTNGAIYSSGNLVLSNVNMNNNTAANGGAIYSVGNLDINNSSFTDNNATSSGGAIYNKGNINIVNTTISSNNALNGAGLYTQSGDVNLSFVTISSNNASNDGGGIYNLNSPSSDIKMINSIVANNTSGTNGNDIFGNINLTSNNVITNTSDAIISGEHNTSLTNISFPLNTLDKTQTTFFVSQNNYITGTCKDINDNNVSEDQLYISRDTDTKCFLGAIHRDKFSINFENASNTNNIKSIYLIGEDGFEHLVSNEINTSNISYVSAIDYDKTYKVKVILDNDSIWYYNFEENSIEKTFDATSKYNKLLNNAFNEITFNIDVSLSTFSNTPTITSTEESYSVSSVSISWDGNASDGFDIYRNGTLIGHTNDKAFIDNNITSNGNYAYVISAKNPYGDNNSTSISEYVYAKSLIVLETGTQSALVEAIANVAPKGTVELNSTILGSNIIYLNQRINISKEMKLIGDGNISIDGNSTTSLFYSEGFDLEIQNMTLQNAYVDGDGAAIVNNADLRLVNVNLNNNQGEGNGVIYSYGNLFLTNVNMNNNMAANGGAVYSYGNLDISNSSFTDNNATNEGGAIYNFGNSKIINSTISSNNANTGAGIYISGGNVDLSFVTISSNNASTNGGGIFNAASQSQGDFSQSAQSTSNLRMKNSILANNLSTESSGNDISGSINLISNNIITDTSTATVIGENNTSLINVSFSLNSLDKTQASYFHSLSNDSLAIGMATCTDIDGLNITKDQLFQVRSSTEKCDLGAIESDKIHFNISNYGNSNNVKSLYIIDENGLEQLVSSNINIETNIYELSTQYGKSYKIKIVLENNSVWYYNFEDNKFYLSMGTTSNYTKLINNDDNTVSFDFNTVLWENDVPSISFVYDQYKNMNFDAFSVELTLNDSNLDALTLNTTITNGEIVNITQSLANGVLSAGVSPDKLIFNITPLNTPKKGKVSINISLSDNVSTTSKSFDITLEDIRYEQDISKVSQNEFDEMTALSIDENITFYSLKNNIYNNYNTSINTVYYDKYTYSNNLFKEKRFIDVNGSLKIIESDDKSYVPNQNTLSIYDESPDNIIVKLKYTQSSESGFTIYKKYLKEILKLNEEVVYKNNKFTSLDDLIASYSYGTNTQGLVRKHAHRAHMLLINPNNDGHLIEVNEDGTVITEDAGTWEIKSVNEYSYLDDNFNYVDLNNTINTLILSPNSTDYDSNIAFAVSNLKFVSRGEYFNINDIYSYVYLDKDLKKEKYAKLSINPKIKKELNFGITYMSLPSSMLLCNENLQSTNTNLCNQDNSLESIFNNNDIKYITKNNGNWSYWDNSNDIKSNYQMDKLSYVDNKEGFILKTTAENISIMMPYVEESVDYNSFIDLYKNDWYLAAVSETKTVNEVKALVEAQNKSLVYILVFRNNTWKIHSFNDILTLSDEEKIEELYINESFWILVEDKN